MSQLRLFGVFFRIGMMSELQYRVNFVVQLLQSLIGLATALAGLGVVFSHTRTLGGWQPAQLLEVVGVYFLVGGFINAIIQPSMQRFMEDVRQGTLDFALTKPEDAQFLISVRQVELWRLLDSVLGLALLVIASAQLSGTVGLRQAITFALTLLTGGAIVYSVWMILATCSFWFVRVDNILVIFQSMYDAGRWPVGIYPTGLRWALTFIVPIAFAITVPAEALVGRLTWETLLGSALLAAVLLVAARWFWKLGLRRYTGASA